MFAGTDIERLPDIIGITSPSYVIGHGTVWATRGRIPLATHVVLSRRNKARKKTLRHMDFSIEKDFRVPLGAPSGAPNGVGLAAFRPGIGE